jgi:transposase-like protein
MATGTDITSEQLAEIERMYASGMTQEAICKRLGIGKRTVSRKVCAMGLGTHSEPWTAKEDQQLAQQVLAGATYAMISRRMGRTRESVRHRVRTLGLGRSPGRASITASMSSCSGQEGDDSAYVAALLAQGGFPTCAPGGLWLWPNLKAAA